MTTGLTADAVSSSGGAAKSQIKDGLERIERQKRLAVGETASRYHAKTKTSINGNGDEATRGVSARAMASTVEVEKAQLQEWLQQPQTHEQLALGETTSRSVAQTSVFLEDIESILDSKAA